MSKATSKYNLIEQVKATFTIRVISIILPLLITPILLREMGQEQYGYWSVMLTLISWMSIFDFGLGHTLKNRLSRLWVEDKKLEIKQEITKSLILLSLFSTFCYLLSFFILRFFDVLGSFEIALIFLVSFASVITSPIFSLSFAIGKSYYKDIVSLSTNLSFLVITYSLSVCEVEFTITLVVFIFSTLNIAFSIVISFYLAIKNNITINVNFKKNEVREYFFLVSPNAIHFFTMQIAYITLYMSDRFIIERLLGPQYVSEYDILYKILSVFSLCQSFLSAPLWSSYSRAFIENNLLWCKKILVKQIQFFFILSLLVSFTSLNISHIITIWIGGDFYYSDKSVIFIAIYIVVLLWNGVFSVFLNSTGNVVIQNYISIFSAVLNVPLSIFLVKFFDMGIEGVILSTIISISFFSVIGPIQVYRLTRSTLR